MTFLEFADKHAEGLGAIVVVIIIALSVVRVFNQIIERSK